MIAKGHSLPRILDAVCLSVEETASGCLCGIMLLDSTGSRLEHSAAPQPSSQLPRRHPRQAGEP